MADTAAALKAWAIYYPAEEYTVFNADVPLISKIKEGLCMEQDTVDEIVRTGIYRCPYPQYKDYQASLACISCAVSELVHDRTGQLLLVETRIEGTPCSSSFQGLNADNVGRLVGLVGTVSRVGYKRIENLEVLFECAKCSRISKVKVKDNIYRTPTCQCRGKVQVFLQGHPENKCIDKQDIKIQELYGTGTSTVSVDVELSGCSVGSVAPGDLVEVAGIIASEQVEDAYRLKIECNNIQVIKNREVLGRYVKGALSSSTGHDGEGAARSEEAAPYSYDNFQMFRTISEDPGLVDVFIDAFYSSIIGHEHIKKGLILALFGGTRKYTGVKTTRSEIHILVVGDPGLGKSRMLLASAGILPKSTLVSGNFCTTAGLTVSITHDPCSGEYMADAGALVVSDGGICCIDEFDKLDDYFALFEVMEDQVVTVAKGGVVCSVPARPTILATANPRHGHFDSSKSVRENIRFDSALLSRFDLIYVMLDNLSEREDYGVCNQILKSRTECAGSPDEGSSKTGGYSREALRAYIEYARNTVSPVLSQAARAAVTEYYLSIRANRGVGIRNLESLIRLTESCAKMQLKSIASVGHARYAIKLYRSVLIKDEAQSKRKATLNELLREHAACRGPFITREELVALIEGSPVRKSPHDLIEILSCQGAILMASTGKYKILLK